MAAKYIHDITVASGSSLNVFHTGRGVDLNLDHHRAGSFANLFTDINLGYGLRPFSSGGRQDRGAHSGGYLPGCALPASILASAGCSGVCAKLNRHSAGRPHLVLLGLAYLQGDLRRFGT